MTYRGNMAAKLVILPFIIFLGVHSFSIAANLDNMKPYEIEEGRIDYKLSGINSGTETLQFKNWGLKSSTRTKTTINIMGMTQKTDQLTITDGLWIYNVDMATNKATKIENPMLKSLVNRDDTTLKKTGEDMMKAMGGKIVGKETVLGKPCDWWEIPQLMIKTCAWKGIPLKSKGGIKGMEVVHTAVNIQLGNIPESQVSLPANVTVVKQEDPLKRLQELRARPRSQGAKGTKGMEGMDKLGESGPQGQDMRKMLEQLKKMQEGMQKQGLGNQ